MAEHLPLPDIDETPWPVLIPMGNLAGKPPIPLKRPVMVIGARQNAHLHLVSRTVSRAHALVVKTRQGVYIRDLASRTHTLVNGQEVVEAWLQPSDEIRIGRFIFEFQPGADRSEHSSAGAAPGSAPPAVLEIDGEPPVAIDQRAVVIGRRAECDVPLTDDDAVSTAHAVVFEIDGRRYVRDLGSRTGTLVNGEPVRQIELRVGDEVRIGRTEFRYVPEPQEAAAAAAAVEEGPPQAFEELDGVPPAELESSDVGEAAAAAALSLELEPPSQDQDIAQDEAPADVSAIDLAEPPVEPPQAEPEPLAVEQEIEPEQETAPAVSGDVPEIGFETEPDMQAVAGSQPPAVEETERIPLALDEEAAEPIAPSGQETAELPDDQTVAAQPAGEDDLFEEVAAEELALDLEEKEPVQESPGGEAVADADVQAAEERDRWEARAEFDEDAVAEPQAGEAATAQEPETDLGLSPHFQEALDQEAAQGDETETRRERAAEAGPQEPAPVAELNLDLSKVDFDAGAEEAERAAEEMIPPVEPEEPPAATDEPVPLVELGTSEGPAPRPQEGAEEPLIPADAFEVPPEIPEAMGAEQPVAEEIPLPPPEEQPAVAEPDAEDISLPPGEQPAVAEQDAEEIPLPPPEEQPAVAQDAAADRRQAQQPGSLDWWGPDQSNFLGGMPLPLDEVEVEPLALDERAAAPEPPPPPPAEPPPPAFPVPPPPRYQPPRPSRQAAAFTDNPFNMGPEDVLAFDESGRVPPYSGVDEAAAGEAAGLDGLATPQVRQADVFSQLPLPAEIDPVLGETRVTWREAEDAAEDSASHEQAGGAEAAAVDAEDPTDPVPDDVPVARHPRPVVPPPRPPVEGEQRRRFTRTRSLLLLMLLCMVAVFPGMYVLMPVQSQIEAAVQYENLSSQTFFASGRFRAEQKQLLQSTATRAAAMELLRSAEGSPSPGFLNQPERFYRVTDSLDWPEDRPGQMVLSFTSGESRGDRRRAHALLMAAYNANAELVSGAANYRARIREQESAITAAQEQLEALRLKIEQEGVLALNRPTEQELSELRGEMERLEQGWVAARVEVKDAQIALENLQAAAARDDQAIQELQAMLGAAESAEAAAQQAYFKAHERWRAADQRLVDARAAGERRDRLSMERDSVMRELDLHAGALEDLQMEAAAAVYPVRPQERDVQVVGVVDMRWMYTAVSWGAIVAVFAVLILLSTRRGDRSDDSTDEYGSAGWYSAGREPPVPQPVPGSGSDHVGENGDRLHRPRQSDQSREAVGV